MAGQSAVPTAPAWGRALGWVRAIDQQAHRRIEASMERGDIHYPWWIPSTSCAGQGLAVLIALAQRDALMPPGWPALVIVLAVVSPLAHFALGLWLPWWLDSAGALVAAGILMAEPTNAGFDLAPALLALITAEAVARNGRWPGVAVGVVSMAMIGTTTVALGLNSWGVHLIDILLGFAVGAMLWWQMRALAAERVARARAWEQATTAERERIAREIHDLVAHSLSVSLLQVTGARRALGDIKEARSEDDVSEAVTEVDDALADAEQVGRRALADIRRTVSTMAAGADRRSLPSAAHIPALVQEYAAAGLAVELDVRGDTRALSDATGLGLYRIAQESLANAVRHGGAGQVDVSLTIGRAETHLRIGNPLPSSRRHGDGQGSGLAGMHARATQLGGVLRAGADGDRWLVDLRLGSASGGLEMPCGRTLRTPTLRGRTT